VADHGRDDDLRVFSGSANPELNLALCGHLGIRSGNRDVHTFGNENIFVRYREDISERRVFLLQSFSSPVNANIMELLVMADAAKRAGARHVTAVVPYYAYGRTDSRSEPRVPITSRLLADLITVAGVHRVVTIDLHAAQIQGFFNIPVDELSSLELFAEHFLDGPRERVVVAPHEGSIRWAKRLAERLRLPLAILEKTTAGGSDPDGQLNLLGDVRDRPVILIENEVDSGGSLARAAHRLVEYGATDVSAAATHAVLSEGAVECLEGAPISELVVTDSLPVPVGAMARLPMKTVSVAPLLAAAIRRIHERRGLDDLVRKASPGGV
jgi:ribose-phosphate pyrophosphokinase